MLAAHNNSNCFSNKQFGKLAELSTNKQTISSAVQCYMDLYRS